MNASGQGCAPAANYFRTYARAESPMPLSFSRGDAIRINRGAANLGGLPDLRKLCGITLKGAPLGTPLVPISSLIGYAAN